MTMMNVQTLLRVVVDSLPWRQWQRHSIDDHYNIETSLRVSHARLHVGNKQIDAHNIGYAGSQPSVVRAALSLIPVRSETDFIDLGCGKGRVLALASEFNFKSICGVEIAPLLAKKAQKNADVMSKKFPGRAIIKIITGDATTPSIGKSARVIVFLYNPFGLPQIKQLVAHFEKTIAQDRTVKIFIVYYNPVHFYAFEQSSYFGRYAAEKYHFTEEEKLAGPFGNDHDSVVIYQSTSGKIYTPQPGAEREVIVSRPNLGAEVVY